MPRRDGWVPTASYLHRNRWNTKTAGIALRRLQSEYYEEYSRILKEVREKYPYEPLEPEVTDETPSTS